MTKTKLEMFRGDTGKWDLVVKQGGAVVDVTGWSFWFTAKREPSDLDAAAVFQKTSADGITITDAAEGLVRLTVAPGDTADLTEGTTLYYDVQGKESGGAIHTLAYGALKITLDATIATS